MIKNIKKIIITITIIILVYCISIYFQIKPITKLTQNIETTSSGLYEDKYIKERYIYKGDNPNNFIEFNNSLWRIISIEPNGKLKIVKYKPSGRYSFNNMWQNSSLETYLNNDFFNSIEKKSKELITKELWNIGPTTNNNLENIIAGEKSKTWEGKIGLLSVSDYLKADDQNIKCKNKAVNIKYNPTCYKSNWINKTIEKGQEQGNDETNIYFWTINNVNSTSVNVIFSNSSVFGVIDLNKEPEIKQLHISSSFIKKSSISLQI